MPCPIKTIRRGSYWIEEKALREDERVIGDEMSALSAKGIKEKLKVFANSRYKGMQIMDCTTLICKMAN